MFYTRHNRRIPSFLTSASKEERDINKKIAEIQLKMFMLILKKIKKTVKVKPSFETKMKSIINTNSEAFMEYLKAMGLNYDSLAVLSGVKSGQNLAKNLNKLLEKKASFQNAQKDAKKVVKEVSKNEEIQSSFRMRSNQKTAKIKEIILNFDADNRLFDWLKSEHHYDVGPYSEKFIDYLCGEYNLEEEDIFSQIDDSDNFIVCDFENGEVYSLKNEKAVLRDIEDNIGIDSIADEYMIR